MTKLVLFDIDGTLVRRHQGHIEAFAVAFRDVYGVYASMYMTDYHGKPDRRIIREVLEHAGIEKDVIDEKIDRCMQVMCDYYESIKPYVTIDLFDGVETTLERLEEDDDILVGLITGNLEPIAYGKLERAGIDSFFRLGGFGNEAIERSELVHSAIRKATREFGFVQDNNVYVVGDTPSDIEAALKSNTHPIAVTTGVYSAEQLRAVGATTIIDGVAHTDDLIAAIG